MVTNGHGSAQLRKAVLDASKSDNWDEASHEWELLNSTKDFSGDTVCVCGHEGLTYLYTIKNSNTNKVLYPIGSECIKLFNNNKLNQAFKNSEKIRCLLNSFIDPKADPVVMTSKYFSSSVLKLMHWAGAFDGGYFDDADKVLDICLAEFNGRKTRSRRVFAVKHIIEDQIRPWVMHVSNWDGSGQSLNGFYRESDLF